MISRRIVLLFVFCSLIIGVKAQLKKPVNWSYTANRISSTEAVIFLKATIDNGWHIYSAYQTGDGPIKTSFKFTPSKDYSLCGKIMETKPIKKYEEAFEIDIFYHERVVVFQQRIKLKGTTVVKGKVSFMACTNEQCLPPEDVGFSIPVS